MTTHRARIDAGGRLAIPAEFRRKLALNSGDSVLLELTDGELRIRSLSQAVAQAQAVLRRYVPAGTSLSEELIAERRAAAARE